MSVAVFTPELQLYVNLSNPNTNYFANKILLVGKVTDSPAATTFTHGVNRSWLRFDISSIPATAVINNAKVILHSIAGHGGGDLNMYTFLNIELAKSSDITWTNALTWNTAPDGTVAAPSANWSANTPPQGESGGLQTYRDLEADITASLASGKVTYRVKSTDETINDTYYAYTNSDFPADYPILIVEYDRTNFLTMF